MDKELIRIMQRLRYVGSSLGKTAQGRTKRRLASELKEKSALYRSYNGAWEVIREDGWEFSE
jgi:hypothetical protein